MTSLKERSSNHTSEILLNVEDSTSRSSFAGGDQNFLKRQVTSLNERAKCLVQRWLTVLVCRDAADTVPDVWLILGT